MTKKLNITKLGPNKYSFSYAYSFKYSSRPFSLTATSLVELNKLEVWFFTDANPNSMDLETFSQALESSQEITQIIKVA